MGILGAGMNFNIGKVGSAAAEAAWVDMTSNTYWQAMTSDCGSWNAGGWGDTGQTGKGPTYRVVLNPLFDTRLWRPTKVRVTISIARPEMSVFGTDGDGGAGDRLWLESAGPSSESQWELDITWDGTDTIDDLAVDADNIYDSNQTPFYVANQGEGDFDLTKIEFFGFLPSFP